MEEETKYRISALVELTKAIISLNKAAMSLQMEALEIHHTNGPKQSRAFLFACFFGLVSMLSFGVSLAALGMTLSIPCIQILGWILAALGMAALVYLCYRFCLLRGERQATDKKLIKIRELFQQLQKTDIHV